MTESESVALPFGDSPMFCCRASQQNVLYIIFFKNASTFFNFFHFFKEDFLESFYLYSAYTNTHYKKAGVPP